MKASFVVGCGSIVLAAAAVACAASGNNEATPPPPDPDAGPAALPDSATPVADAAVEASVAGPMCSKAGWCATSLPDTDLMMKDIWPLPGHAFAVAESPTLGVKVLEWADADAKWKYIDDNTQNEPGFGKYAGKIWAPNENEVYFGVAPGTIYHGRRTATAWSWTRQRLEDNSHKGAPSHDPTHDHGYPFYQEIEERVAALGVWGTGSDEVYAWYSNTIFRWTSEDGGAATWVAEYVADDPDDSDEHLIILAAGGSRGDVWFSGARDNGWYSCGVAVHKTSEGYRRIVDGVVTWNFYDPCTPRPGFLHLGGGSGWLTDIQPAGANRVVALKGTRDVARISQEGGNYAASVSTTPWARSQFYSLWWAPENVWLSGWGLVAQGTDVWDGGTYELSTISLSGGPLNRPMYRIRGTSNTNLWAIGVRYALHKTTP